MIRTWILQLPMPLCSNEFMEVISLYKLKQINQADNFNWH